MITAGSVNIVERNKNKKILKNNQKSIKNHQKIGVRPYFL